MTAQELDPLIHVPARLRIVATLAALPDGDTLSFTRLQDMIGLTPGNLITHLRKLEDAGYIDTEKTGNGVASRTSVALTRQGRTALDTYTAMLRDLLARAVAASELDRRQVELARALERDECDRQILQREPGRVEDRDVVW